MKKYISPASWFSLEYPNAWSEFEDAEDCFLFYNPERWSGNFRISAYRGGNNKYAADCIAYELKENKMAKRVKVGNYDCAYSVDGFQENGQEYQTHFWVTGTGELSVECSFTVAKGGDKAVAEAIIASLRIRQTNDKPWKEVIPVRVLEINEIDEAYDWAVSTIKKQLTKDFTSSAQDVASIQKVIDSGKFGPTQRNAWEAFGVAFGSILVNEMDGMDWVTVIDGRKEVAALRFEDSNIMVYPMDVVWTLVKDGQTVDLKKVYARIKSEVEQYIQNKED